MNDKPAPGVLGLVAGLSGRADEKSAAAMVSVASNSALVAFKLVVGLAIGSVSVMSEAIHSGMDLIAAAIACFAVRTSSKPADRDHPFGHGKFENLSGAIEALLIFAAAGWIVCEAARKLAHPRDIESAGWGVAVMLASCAANVWVSRMLFAVGKRTDSVALLADAWHLRTDVYTSAGVMLGLLLYEAGRVLLPGVDLRWIDPAAAIAVALLIVKAAYGLTMQSVRDLLDASLPDEEQGSIKRRILERIRAGGSRALSYRNLGTRKSGAVRFIRLDLVLEPGLSVKEAHDVADDVAAALRDLFPGAEVAIHVEPCAGDCADECRESCASPLPRESARRPA